MFVLAAVSVVWMVVVSKVALLRLGLGLSTLSALLLLAPWAGSGMTDRSMFALISSASALDLLSSFEEAVVVFAVISVVIAAGIALVAAAWSRYTLTAGALLVPGPILLAATVVIAQTRLSLRWGAVASSTAGITGSICASMILLIGSRSRNLST